MTDQGKGQEGHEFDDGGKGDTEYCWAHVSMFGRGDCGQPRSAPVHQVGKGERVGRVVWALERKCDGADWLVLNVSRDMTEEYAQELVKRHDLLEAAFRKQYGGAPDQFRAMAYEPAAPATAAERERLQENYNAACVGYQRVLTDRDALKARVEELEKVRPAALSMLDEILALPDVESPSDGENAASVVNNALEHLRDRAEQAESANAALKSRNESLELAHEQYAVQLKYERGEVSALKAEVERLTELAKPCQRERDLNHYMRGELLDAHLITTDEWTDLLERDGGSKAARRLEDYDDLRAKLTAAESEAARLREEPDLRCSTGT